MYTLYVAVESLIYKVHPAEHNGTREHGMPLKPHHVPLVISVFYFEGVCAEA